MSKINSHEKKVIVVGSINTDLVVYVDELPQPGQTISGNQFAEFSGGKGANQAVAAVRAGVETVFLGAVGNDVYGMQRCDDLKREGMDVSGVLVLKNCKSGIALIEVDKHGENHVVVISGANAGFGAEIISEERLKKCNSAIILFQNEISIDANFEIIKCLNKVAAQIIWNIAPALTRLPPPDVLDCIDFLIVNETELLSLCGESLEKNNKKIADLAEKLVEKSLRNLIVTCGSRGSFWTRRDSFSKRPETFYQEPLSVEAVDSVGAGDCFCGVFAAGMSKHGEVRNALAEATAASALSVQKKGAQAAMPYRKEIDKALLIMH